MSEIIDKRTEQKQAVVQPVTANDFPTEVVQLPSKGLLYPEDSPLASGTVELRYMTAKEEDILSTQSYIKQGIVLDKLCEALIVTPGVKYNDILVGDKNAILFAARAYGYGAIYQTTVTTEVGSKIPVEINLLDLPHKEFDESLITRHVNRFTFKLPKAGSEVTFKLLTVGDQRDIDKSIQSQTKFNLNASTKNLTTRFRYMITAVDGKEEKGVINKFIDNMLAVDSRTFREYIAKIQPDVDIMVEGLDPETGEPFRNNFDIGLDLFYPDYKG